MDYYYKLYTVKPRFIIVRVPEKEGWIWKNDRCDMIAIFNHRN
jgi:hypothetical protein